MLTLRSMAVLLSLAVAQGFCILLIVDRYGGGWGAVPIVLVPALVIGSPLLIKQLVNELQTLGKQLTWWHVLWLLIGCSGLVFRIRDTESIRETPLDAAAAYRVSLVALVALALGVRLVLGKTPWLRSLRRGLVGVMAGFALLCLVTTVWSVYPAWTLYKSVEFLIDIVLLAAILVHLSSLEQVKSLFDWTWAICSFFLLTVWAGTLFWPEEALVRGIGFLGIQLQGVFPIIGANSVGQLAATLALVALNRLQLGSFPRPRHTLYGLMLAVSLVTLVLSQTRSAIAGFAFGMAVVFLLARRIGVVTFLIWILALVFSLTDAGEGLATYLRRGQDPGNIQSLTGRVDWWTVGWNRFLERPLTGYGAYAGGRFVALEEIGETSTSTMHSTYLEVLLGTGLPGVVLILAALGGAGLILIRTARSSPAASLERQLTVEAAAVLALLTTRSLFSSVLVWHPELIFLAVLGCAEFLRRQTKLRGRARGSSPRVVPRLACPAATP